MRPTGALYLSCAVAVFAGGCGAAAPGFTTVDAVEARALVAAGAGLVVVDVSPSWGAGHIPGALSYPLHDGALRRALPGLDRQRPHLVCGHEDAASIAGAQLLGAAGIAVVYRLEGNFAAWMRAGYPVERPVVELDAAAAKALIDSTPALVVVDVSLQWKEGHIPGAKSYPMSGGWLEIGLPGLDPQRPHLVYARTDEASLAGAQLLASRGFHPVYRLRGNLAAWQDAGHPVALPRPAVLAVDAEEAQIIISTTPPLEAIDVSKQWTAGHIPGARSYPLADGSLARALRTLDKRRPYLVYGREPGPSFEAAQLLVDQGFGPVYWLEGGFQSWVDAGYAVGLPDPTVTALSPTRAKQLIDATPELVIVDVSTAWAAGHLPGALSYPLAGGALDAALPGLDRSRPHLIYGREGDDALAAASRIAFAGFRFVYLLDGGFAAWVAAGLPIEP